MMNKKLSILTVEHPFESLAFQALVGVSFVLIFSYIYFVSASVLNIIVRKEAVAEAAQISTAIGNSEQKYFAMSQGVTLEAGAVLGLAPVSKTAYVYRPGTVGQAATLRNEI